MAISNLFSNAKFWRLGAISLLISTLPIPAIAQLVDNGDKVPYRLLIPLLQPAPPPGEAAQLQVGPELPALPIDLPTPQSGVLQWSLINRPQYFTLLFEVAQSRSQTAATYVEQLQASGWRPWSIEQFSPKSSSESLNEGFIIRFGGPDEFQSEPLILCKPGSSAQLLLRFFQANPDRTKLQIDLIFDQPHSICTTQDSTSSKPFPKFVLSPPTDAQTDLISGGGSSDYSEIQVSIQTPLPLEALADHYAAQMRQQGWNLQTTTSNDLLQWSVWSRHNSPDSSQQATIHLFATEKTNQYIGAFRAQSSPGRAVSLAFPTYSVQAGELPQATALQILRDRGQIPDSESYQLWLEQLPPSLSTEIAIPSKTAILGGASTVNTDTAILETSLHPQTVRTFYRESLTTAGWQTPEIGFPFDSSAFETSGFHSYLLNVFCQPEEGAEIVLNTLMGPNDLTMVRLSLYPSGEFSPCHFDLETYSLLNRNFWANIPVPNLQTPPETTVWLNSSGNLLNSTVYLQTRLTATALADHYVGQMRQAGWTQRTATHSEGSSVSLWRIETDTGNVWEGLLSFIAQSEMGYWTGQFSAFSGTQEE